MQIQHITVKNYNAFPSRTISRKRRSLRTKKIARTNVCNVDHVFTFINILTDLSWAMLPTASFMSTSFFFYYIYCVHPFRVRARTRTSRRRRNIPRVPSSKWLELTKIRLYVGSIIQPYKRNCHCVPSSK